VRVKDVQGSDRARELRRNQTEAGKAFWFRVRNRRLDGYKFRRQVPIGPYIADFVCTAARFVVEIDAGQHSEQVAITDANVFCRKKDMRSCVSGITKCWKIWTAC
jgi:very-short-patch-repair endonuclease